MLTNDELKAIGKRADATNEDAEFIAHAREDIQALLAHIKYYEDAINTLMHHSTDFESKFYNIRSILRKMLAHPNFYLIDPNMKFRTLLAIDEKDQAC